MHRTFRIILILYFNPLVKAVNLKIDGLINLGPNWGYEYRILAPDKENEDREIGRFGKHYKPVVASSTAEEDDEEEALVPYKESFEDNIRHESLRVEPMIPHQTHKKFKSTESIEYIKLANPRIPIILAQKYLDHIKVEDRHNTDTDSDSDSKSKLLLKKQKPNYEKVKVLVSEERPLSPTRSPRKATTWSSANVRNSKDSSSSSDSREKTTKTFDMYDFTTSSRIRKKTTKFESVELHKRKKHKRKHDTGPVNEDAISYDEHNMMTTYRDKDNIPVEREKTLRTRSSVNTKRETSPTTRETVPVTNATTSPTIATTKKTIELNKEPHKVKDDVKIREFTKHIYTQTLKVFDTLKKQTNEYHIKKEIDVLAKGYDHKFKEFLRDTSDQKIKTNLGTQKVVLNTIDMSNRILKRLINYLIGDMEKKGVLRNNVATTNIFQKEIDKEQAFELNHACKKFGVCRTVTGFPIFITDVISLILYTDQRKFKQTIDALTEVVKSTDFRKHLKKRTEKKIKDSMERIEMLNLEYIRTMLLILKNIIIHKNQPVIVNNHAASVRVNATLAFLEIIDVLDQNTPQNEANVLEWNDILTSLKDFVNNVRTDVQEIMEIFIKHLKKTLKAMSADDLVIIERDLNIVFGEWS